MSDGVYTLLSAAIGTAGPIIAALIAMKSARKIVKEDIQPIFSSYADQGHDARQLFIKARENIVIVAPTGDYLLKRYGTEIGRCLRSGVNVYYLMHTKDKLYDMDVYLRGQQHQDENTVSELHDHVIAQLRNLDMDPDSRHLHIREFPSFMTASYIGIDIPFPTGDAKTAPPHSVIQIMQYQYQVISRNSMSSLIVPDRDEKFYEQTVRSIQMMWDMADDAL